jgi:hypothetical protein
LNTLAVRSNEPSVTSAVTATPAVGAHSQVGPACSRVMPEPTATRSAAMLRAFAPINATSSTPVRVRAVRLRHWVVTGSPRPLPVARAVRSQISCTAVISGNVSRLVHSIPKPVAAPACE